MPKEKAHRLKRMNDHDGTNNAKPVTGMALFVGL